MTDDLRTDPQGGATLGPAGRPDEADPAGPDLSPEGRKTVRAVREALEDALGQLESAEQAEALVDRVLAAVEAMGVETTADLRARAGESSAPEARRAIERAADAAGSERLEATLIEAARQVARGEGETRAALDEAVQEATNPEQRGAENPATRRSRDWLTRAIIRRMGPVRRIDTRLFLLLNGLPHTELTNRAMYGLSAVMNGGGGWLLLLLPPAVLGRGRHLRALHSVLPPLWLATMAVEFPIKRFFRRRRPFLDVVQAIAVGRKPIGFSFPSGHSAAAFAGAWLIRRHYPRLAPALFGLAGLVGFSRVYLGVHYPGDVLSGAISGVLIAELARWSIEQSNVQKDLSATRG